MDHPFPAVELEGFDDVVVVRPGIDWYVERLRDERPFAFVKRTHGIWDYLVDLAEVHPPFRALVDEALRRDDPAFPAPGDVERVLALDEDTIARLEMRKPYKGFWEGGFARDIVVETRNPHADERWIEANSFRGYSGSDAKPALHPVAQLREVYLAIRSRATTYHDALTFKDGMLDGGFRRVLDALAPMRVVLVGPPHLAKFGSLAGLPKFDFVRIHPTDAVRERERVLEACRRKLAPGLFRRTRGPTAFVFQAGWLSWWLMYRLFPEAPDVWQLDVGRTLDAWYPGIAKGQNWFRADRDAIVSSMRLEKIYR